MEADKDVFENVMLQVGNSGRFQRTFNIVFNFIFIFFATMASFNIINALATPDHWCKVPGRELTNFSLDDWKSATIPRHNDTGSKFSKCEMFNTTENTGSKFPATTECLHGWEYDRTYFKETIPSQEDWVCGKTMHVANALMFSKLGEIIGTFFFSQLGDAYGRKPVYYLSLTALFVGRLGLLISSSIYPLFLAFVVFGNLSGLTVYQTALVIGMEISNDKDRTYINLLQCISWTLGLCALPLLYWIVGSWVPFLLISTLPLLPFFFLCDFMIESPRWLVGKGKMKVCIRELKKIAKLNKRELSDSVFMTLGKDTVSTEKVYGVMSLFSTWNLAKRTILITIGWTCCVTIYVIMIFNISNLGGNPFMNFFWQGLAELPGYILGKYLTDSLGRKYTRCGSFTAIALVSAIMAYFLSSSGSAIVITICGIALKFLASIEFYTINLHTLECYPTCVRQTGAAVGYLIANIFGIFAPYIIHLGVLINPGYPYVFAAVLGVVGAVFGIFLPETLNEKLPDTIKEAEHFGHDQKLWSLPKRRRNDHTIVNGDLT